MKITKNNLKRMIMEELKTSLDEAYGDQPQMTDAERDMHHGDPNPYGASEESSRLSDPSNSLEMSAGLEGFLDEVLKTAEQQLGITADDPKSDDTYSLLLTLMTPDSVLVGVMASALAEMYKSGDRGTHDNPLNY